MHEAAEKFIVPLQSLDKAAWRDHPCPPLVRADLQAALLGEQLRKAALDGYAQTPGQGYFRGVQAEV